MSSQSFIKKSKKKTTNSTIDLSKLETTFILNDINPVKLDKTFSMNEIQNIHKTYENTNNTSKINIKNNGNELKSITTKLANLGFSEKNKEPIFTTLHGSSKINVFTNFMNKRELLTYNDSKFHTDSKDNCQLKCNCWWDRNSLSQDMIPLALPIKYVPSYIENKLLHNSLINMSDKLEYKINENIELNDKDKHKIFLDRNIITKNDISNNSNINKLEMIINEYYEGEGIFCSFNCMISYLKEVQSHNIKYKNSSMLILKMYKDIFGFYPNEMILEAPNWKILKEYGGDFSIEEFRKCFQVVTYKELSQYMKVMPSGPINNLFVEVKN
jgi:hypothetical protein